jgi:acetyl esterase/lipase
MEDGAIVVEARACRNRRGNIGPMKPLSALPQEVRHELLEIGPIWGRDTRKHRDRVFALYAKLLERAPKAGASVTRDVPYAAHPRQCLDVFRPERARDADVVVFLHGGAFVRGDKRVTPEVYDNVLYWFARQGCVGFNIEYRLAPESQYPGGATDVALAVAWVRAHAREHGGNPARIFLIGHSAGATHAAAYACDPVVRPAEGLGLAGLVLISGRLRADARPDNPNAAAVRAYFGDDESLYDVRSPVTHAANLDVPVFIAIAEHENPLLDVYGAEFLHRVSAARGRAPRFLRLCDHNHISMVAHFNTEEEILGREILEFFAAGK